MKFTTSRFIWKMVSILFPAKVMLSFASMICHPDIKQLSSLDFFIEPQLVYADLQQDPLRPQPKVSFEELTSVSSQPSRADESTSGVLESAHDA